MRTKVMAVVGGLAVALSVGLGVGIESAASADAPGLSMSVTNIQPGFTYGSGGCESPYDNFTLRIDNQTGKRDKVVSVTSTSYGYFPDGNSPRAGTVLKKGVNKFGTVAAVDSTCIRAGSGQNPPPFDLTIATKSGTLTYPSSTS
jgi:hypothetical protein